MKAFEKPLYPTEGLKRLCNSALREADVILSTTPQKPSKVIRLATRSDISHAMVCAGPYSVIEATRAGVHSRNTQRLFFHASGPLYLLRLRATPASAQLSAISDFVRARVGTRYTIPEAVQAGAGVKVTLSRKQFCSRLVAQAFSSAGIQLVSDPDYCSPEDLKNSPLLEAIDRATESVDLGLFQNVENTLDVPAYMASITNKALVRIRKLEPSIEDINDTIRFLRRHPEYDLRVHAAMKDTGFLDACRVEIGAKTWQYDLGAFRANQQSIEDKRRYCVELIASEMSFARQYVVSLANLLEYFEENNLETFRALADIYEELISMLRLRVLIANHWLSEDKGEGQ